MSSSATPATGIISIKAFLPEELDVLIEEAAGEK